jgi:hypothetical protein
MKQHLIELKLALEGAEAAENKVSAFFDKLDKRLTDFGEKRKKLKEDAEAMDKYLTNADKLLGQRNWAELVPDAAAGEFFRSFSTGMQQSSAAMNDWLDRVNDFTGSIQGASKAVGSFVGTENKTQMYLMTAGLIGLDAAAKDLVPALNQLRTTFQLLTGQELVPCLKQMQEITKQCGSLELVFGSTATSAQKLAGAAGIVGAAFLGWQIGKAIGDLKLFGLTVNERVTVTMLEAMKVWTKFKHAMGFMGDNDFFREMRSLNTSTQQMLWKTGSSSGAATAGAATEGVSEPAAPGKVVDREKEERDHQRAYMSARSALLAQLDADKQLYAEKAIQTLRNLDIEYRETAASIETTLDEKLAKLDEVAEKEKGILAERDRLEHEAVEKRIAQVQSDLDRLAGKTGPEAIAQQKELEAQRTRLEAEKNVMGLRQEMAEQAREQRIQTERVRLYKEAQTQIDQTNAASAEAQKKKAADDLQQLDQGLKQEMKALNNERTALDKNFMLTDVEKRTERIRLLQEERDLLDEQLTKLRELAAQQTDDAARKLIEDEIKGVEKQREGVETSQKGFEAEADPESFSEQIGKNLTALENKFGTTAESIGRGFSDIVGASVQSVQGALTGLIQGTLTWKDALMQVGGTIVNSVISAFSKMVAEWLTKRALMAAKEILFSTQETTAKAPKALMESISSYGVAAAVGIGALMAAMAAIGGGFQSGGYTGDGAPSQVAGLVHRGEMVFDQGAVQAIGRERLESMRVNRAVPAGLAGAGAVGGGNTTFAPSVDVPPPQVHVAVLDRPEKIAAFMKSLPGQAIIVDAIKGNRMELGINS